MAHPPVISVPDSTWSAIGVTGLDLSALLEDHPLYDDGRHVHADLDCAGHGATVLQPRQLARLRQDRRPTDLRSLCRSSCTSTHRVVRALSGTGPLAGLSRAATHLMFARDELRGSPGERRLLDEVARHTITCASDLQQSAVHLARTDPTVHGRDVHAVALEVLDHLRSELDVTRGELTRAWRGRPKQTSDDVLIWFHSGSGLRNKFGDLARKHSALPRRGLATWPVLAASDDYQWAVCQAPASVLDDPSFEAAVEDCLLDVLPHEGRELTSKEWDVFSSLVNSLYTLPVGALTSAQAVMA